MIDEHDFVCCPYCGSAKSEECATVVDEKHRFLKVVYNCGTEIEVEWDGPDAYSKWKAVCLPRKN